MELKWFLISYYSRETEDLDTNFINIVSTQAVCLLKLGDYVTSKKFAEQVCIKTTVHNPDLSNIWEYTNYF